MQTLKLRVFTFNGHRVGQLLLLVTFKIPSNRIKLTSLFFKHVSFEGNFLFFLAPPPPLRTRVKLILEHLATV
jgi:hypothetical protein